MGLIICDIMLLSALLFIVLVIRAACAYIYRLTIVLMFLIWTRQLEQYRVISTLLEQSPPLTPWRKRYRKQTLASVKQKSIRLFHPIKCLVTESRSVFTILKNILSLVFQIFLYLETFECNTISDWLNHTV